MHAEALVRLTRLVRMMAIAIGVVIAVTVPASFGIHVYLGELEARRFQARLAADRVAQDAYVQGPLWRFAERRIGEMIAFVIRDDHVARLTVTDRGGALIDSVGDAPVSPVLRAGVPIMVGAEQVGTVRIESSLRPLLWRFAIFVLVGAALGASVYACVHYLPLRALRRTTDSLEVVQASLRAQISQTEAALAKAQDERQRAEIANEAKNEFLANMSHELRTPLNAVIGFSELMKQEAFGPLSARYKSYCEDIHASGVHLLKIINDVLDISRIETGQSKLMPSVVVLDDLLVDCLKLVVEAAERGGVAMVSDLAADRPATVTVDRVKTKQIVVNLLANAVKFTRPGGKVTLAARTAGTGWLEIDVRDTGVGMTAEEIGTALRVFGQTGDAFTRNHQGTGLGLSIAKGLAELHGGELRLTSAPGEGTTATVRLPIGDQTKTGEDASWIVDDTEAAA